MGEPECIFCGIAAGRNEADVVFEDDLSMAFLDRRPVFVGHTLLIPKAHHETLTDLPDELVQPLFATTKRLTRAVTEALGADGTFVAMNNKISQSVPHLHVHVVPRRKKDGLRGFFWPRQQYRSDEDRTRIAETIRSALS